MYMHLFTSARLYPMSNMRYNEDRDMAVSNVTAQTWGAKDLSIQKSLLLLISVLPDVDFAGPENRVQTAS